MYSYIRSTHALCNGVDCGYFSLMAEIVGQRSTEVSTTAIVCTWLYSTVYSVGDS